MREQLRHLYKELLLYGFAEVHRTLIDEDYITVVLVERAVKRFTSTNKSAWETRIRWRLND